VIEGFGIAFLFPGSKETAMKRIALGMLLVLSLGSCNTMIGVGRDFRQLGEGLENKASGRNFDGSEPAPEEESIPTY
jgi:predicted small secreted protein